MMNVKGIFLILDFIITNASRTRIQQISHLDKRSIRQFSFDRHQKLTTDTDIARKMRIDTDSERGRAMILDKKNMEANKHISRSIVFSLILSPIDASIRFDKHIRIH